MLADLVPLPSSLPPMQVSVPILPCPLQVGISACDELDVAAVMAAAGDDKEKQQAAVAQAGPGEGGGSCIA